MNKFILFAFFTLLFVGFKQAPPGKFEKSYTVEQATVAEAVELQAFALRPSELFIYGTLNHGYEAAKFADATTRTEGPARLRLWSNSKKLYAYDTNFGRTSKYGRAEKDADNRKT